jgi:heptosyltransferase-2
MEWLFWLGGFRGRRTKVENILVVRLDRLGDLTMTSGFLRALREDFPAAKISLAVRNSLEPLARICPDVDEVIGLSVNDCVFPSERDEWLQFISAWFAVCWEKKIWRRRFDLAIVPRRDVDDNGAIACAYLSGARERIGFSERASRDKAIVNAGFDSLLTQIISDNCEGHEIASLVRLRKALGKNGGFGLVPWVSADSRLLVNGFLKDAGLFSRHILIVVCMGAGAPSRCWPVKNYASLLNGLAAKPQVRLLTIGSAAEAWLGTELKSLLGSAVVNCEGRLPLETLPALMEKCSLYVGSDTGPMHLATAASLPVFEISCHALTGDQVGKNSPIRFGPWAVPSRVAQPAKATAPCSDGCKADSPHCILGIDVELAVVALEELIQECGLATILVREDVAAI